MEIRPESFIIVLQTGLSLRITETTSGIVIETVDLGAILSVFPTDDPNKVGITPSFPIHERWRAAQETKAA